MTTPVDPTQIVIGAGEAFVDGVSVGPTEANNILTITPEWFTPQFNGIPGPVMGTDYVKKEMAELEMTLPEIGAANLALIHPNSSPATYVVSTPTTLAATSLVADKVVKVTSITGLTVGAPIDVGAPGSVEINYITSVGTAGAGGTGVGLLYPLGLSHPNGDAVSAPAATSISSLAGTSRRVALAAYHIWELRVPGLAGLLKSFVVRNAIQVDAIKFEAKDDGALAPKIKVQSRWDGSNSSVSPWNIYNIPAPA